MNENLPWLSLNRKNPNLNLNFKKMAVSFDIELIDRQLMSYLNGADDFARSRSRLVEVANINMLMNLPRCRVGSGPPIRLLDKFCMKLDYL